MQAVEDEEGDAGDAAAQEVFADALDGRVTPSAVAAAMRKLVDDALEAAAVRVEGCATDDGGYYPRDASPGMMKWRAAEAVREGKFRRW